MPHDATSVTYFFQVRMYVLNVLIIVLPLPLSASVNVI
jgi:hypothetical protein